MFIDLFDKTTITGSVKDVKPINIVLVSGTEEELIWDDLVHKYHYLSYKKMFGKRVKYLVLSKSRPLAALSFNSASIKLKARDQYIGWSNTDRKKYLHRIVNNNRFLIFPWVKVKNLASFTLSHTLDRLVEDWFNIYNVKPLLVETFIELNRYKGISYKAANWIYVGETKGYTKKRESYKYHGNVKGVYLYPLKKDFRKTIVTKKQKKPKTQQKCQKNNKQKPSHSRTHKKKTRGSIEMLNHDIEWDPNIIDDMGLTIENVKQLPLELLKFHTRFEDSFSHISQIQHSLTYLQGLMSNLDRKNIESIALEFYKDTKGVRNLQHYMQKGTWDDEIMHQNYLSILSSLISSNKSMITIDESDFPKKGNESVAVGRQYCGRLGKKENCQAGVFLGYTSKKGYGLLERQLYVPEKWFSDEYEERRQKCVMPDELTFMTKTEIALKLLENVNNTGLFPAQWVGCDSAFGCNKEFLDEIGKKHYYFADIKSNTKVWLERPEVGIPSYKGRGRKPTKERPLVNPVSVSDIAKDPSLTWRKVILGDGAKGPVVSEIACLRVIESRDDLPGQQIWLYIRKHTDGKIRYAISNAPRDISLKELNKVSIMRWPIEQLFETGKSELGMDHYETRSWNGWNRHMLYVFIAQLFLFKIQLKFKKNSNFEFTTG